MLPKDQAGDPAWTPAFAGVTGIANGPTPDWRVPDQPGPIKLDSGSDRNRTR
jgi:hypothetical protein